MAYSLPYVHTMCSQIEQFHTVVKGLARGPRNTVASIRNHYLLLVSSNFTRLAMDVPWVVKPRVSTAAGYLGRTDSANKMDLFVAPKGKEKITLVSQDELLQLQTAWTQLNPDYGAFHQRFSTAMARLPREERLNYINEWTDMYYDKSRLTEEEKTWQLMDGSTKVISLQIVYCRCP
jgi:hypothetical protein